MEIKTVETILAKYPDPQTGQSILDAKRVVALRIEDKVLKGVINFSNADDARDFQGLYAEMVEQLSSLDFIDNVQLVLSAEEAKSAPPPPILKPEKDTENPNKFKTVIAIASGKGGVGKSTVTANLAVALAKMDKKVGLLDADFYGPSQVMMMGVTEKPASENNRIIPTQSHNVKSISLAQMVNEGEAIVWRGPMLMKALDQLLNDVNWGALDVLLIDLPPGTGDIQLSLSQKVKLTGAIIVTTPQDIALLDARRGMSMFEKLNVPLLGMIENMATHICTECGHEEHIFGEGGAKREAEERNIPYLGALPLSKETREAGDEGIPIALKGETIFNDIASRLIAGKIV